MSTCHYLLDNGQRCRCFANRHSDYCRHHQPHHLQRRQPTHSLNRLEAEPRPMTRHEMSIGWRGYHAWIREANDPEELQEVVDMILTALGNRNISPRSAGLLLQDIEDRRRQLDRMQTLSPALRQQAEALLAQLQATPNGGVPC
ncbi:MAG: hypothetical protein WBW84_09575 [Acidobacteriaceae bacterium]